MTIAATSSCCVPSSPATPVSAMGVRKISHQYTAPYSAGSANAWKRRTTMHSDRYLQSADKRRRYLRRGSKTAFMLRGSFRMDLPLVTSSSRSGSSSALDDSSHSTSSNATWSTSSTTSLSVRSLAESLQQDRTTPATPLSCCGSKPTLTPFQWDQLQPPFATTDSVCTEAEDEDDDDSCCQPKTTVTLITTALELSSIHDDIKTTGL